jgi:hypothetical protein
MDAVSIGAWAAARNPDGDHIPEDYELYDTTQNASSQETSFITMWRWGHDSEVIDHMRHNVATYGTTLHGGKYSGPPSVHSGDATTTCNNTNGSGVHKSYAITRTTGLTPKQLRRPPYKQPYSVIVGGDDTLHIKQPHLPLIDPKYEQSLGLHPEYEPLCKIADSTFLSALFIPVDVDGVPTVALLPKPGRILARFGWSLIPPQKQNYLSYIRGNVLGLRPLYTLPAVGPFLLKHLALTQHRKPLYHNAKDYGFSRSLRVSHNITANEHTHAWFNRRYQTTSDDYRHFHLVLENVTSLPTQIPYSYVRPYYERDVGPTPPITDNHDYRNS